MSLTAREIEIVALAVQCCKDAGGFKVDYDKLADKGNFKNAASATAVWCSIKKKLFSANTGTPSPKAALGKSTAETSAAGGADNDGFEEGSKFTPINTPTKKRGRKPKDDAKPSPKRAKKTVVDTAAPATGNPSGSITRKASPTADSKYKTEYEIKCEPGHEPEHESEVPADLKEEILQGASDGFLHPSENPEKSQGN